jgi:tetratricopeptide (TPR) repeat protein
MRRLSGSTAFSSQNAMGSLTVTVQDATGAPVRDARVEIRDSQVGMPVKSGYTNASGTVELTGVPFNVYEVAVSKGLNQMVERVPVQSMAAAVSVNLGASDGQNVGGKTSVSVAQYKVPGKARKEYEKAKEALNDRKVEEAEKRLAKALEIYPKFGEALTMRAILKMDRNEFESAEADLTEALSLDPTNATTYFVYGANLNLQSKFDAAIQALERGVSLNPTGWQGYFELGKSHVAKQKYQQALKYLDKAQAMSRVEYAPIHLVKAHALLALKEYDPAMGELQAYLDKAPEDSRSAEARKTLEQVKAFVAKK